MTAPCQLRIVSISFLLMRRFASKGRQTRLVQQTAQCFRYCLFLSSLLFAAAPGYAQPAPSPLLVWSPAATDSCVSTLGSLDEFRKLVPAFEATGRQLDRTPRSIFKGPDLGRYELLHPPPGTPGAEMLPADVRKLLGWSDEDARSPGACPFRR